MPYNDSLSAPWRALRGSSSDAVNSSFARLWLAVVAANFADGILRVVLPLFAVVNGANALEVSIVVAGSSVPWFLGTMPAGVAADRFERSTVIRVASFVRILIGLILLAVVLTETTSIAALTGLAVLFGAAEVASDVSSQTEVAAIVHPDGLERAYGRLTSGQLGAELLIGPAFAGAVFQWSPTAVVTVTILSFAVAGVAVRSSRPRLRDVGSTSRWWTDAFHGLKVLASHHWLRRAAIAAGVLNFTSAGSAAVLVTYALSSSGLDLSERNFGFLLTAIGVGGVIGALGASRIHTFIGDERSLLLGASGFVLADLAPGLIRQPVALAITSSIGFAIGMIYSTKVVSVRQRVIDDAIRGRVTAASQFIGTSAAPLGAVVGGVLATSIGFRPTFLVLGSVAICGALASHPWTGLPAAHRSPIEA